MSALQRKAQSGRQEHQARAMSVPKALRLASARVADKLYGLALATIALTQEVRDNAAIKEALEQEGLMLVFDGPDGPVGAAVADLVLVSALIQQQTTGRVFPGEPMQRAFTPTDASLCAPLFVELLKTATGLLETEEDRRVLEGFSFGARVENRRLLEMALQAQDYNVIRLTFDIAGGMHQGSLSFYLPKRPPIPAPWSDAGETADAPVDSASAMEEVVLSLNVDLPIVLHRFRLPLTQVGLLATGDVLTLPEDCFSKAQVVVPGGRVITTGTLGQSGGKRALRLKPGGRGGQTVRMQPEAKDDFDGLTLDGTLAAPPSGAMALDMPDLGGGFGDLPALDANLDLPDLPDPGELPDLGTLPEPGELPDLGDMPDLPDLPELGDLPQLDGLPDLPKIDID
ncbi:FliM/FliN family flagellar motor switch protein [Sulfitobacter sp. LCG007]